MRLDRRTRAQGAAAGLALFLAVTLGACGSGLRPTQFTHPRFNFGFVERVAVVPLENLTNDRSAGLRATRMILTELLASGAVEALEPGEVQAALNKIRRTGDGSLSSEQVIAMGQALGVQALILGTVTDSEVLRTGAVAVPVVTLDLRMLETETGSAVWAATHTEKGGGLGARFLGTGAEPISETTRRCVRRTLATLLK
jgi:polysaccharide biosynthesis protein PelC